MKIGIQGVRASFHDVAARQFFHGEAVEAVECRTFRRLCETLANGESDHAMMAIENSIAGSILPNYGLLESYGFQIIGETYLRIEMCLLGLPTETLADVRFVQSHPMAILQCEDFLATLPDVKAIEFFDTAEAAKEIQALEKRGFAAIAGKLAAETYGLKILKEGIETNRQNYTRFLALARRKDHRAVEGANKASLRFEAAHRPGSLADVLTLFKDHRVNLTKIQSVPLMGKPYQYGFHVDLEWSDEAAYRRAMAELPKHASEVLNLGEYRREERPR